MAANGKRATTTVTGLLLEANWKEHTAEIYPDAGPVVKVRFPEDLSDAIQRAARQRVRVTGRATRPRNGPRRLQVEELEVLDGAPGLDEMLQTASAQPRADPFAHAKPLVNVWDLFPPLPDERSADEIIEDIRACRLPHQEDE